MFKITNVFKNKLKEQSEFLEKPLNLGAEISQHLNLGDVIVPHPHPDFRDHQTPEIPPIDIKDFFVADVKKLTTEKCRIVVNDIAYHLRKDVYDDLLNTYLINGGDGFSIRIMAACEAVCSTTSNVVYKNRHGSIDDMITTFTIASFDEKTRFKKLNDFELMKELTKLNSDSSHRRFDQVSKPKNVVIASSAGQGKTLAMVNIACSLSQHEGHSVVYISDEITRESFFKKILASGSVFRLNSILFADSVEKGITLIKNRRSCSVSVFVDVFLDENKILTSQLKSLNNIDTIYSSSQLRKNQDFSKI